MAVQVCVISFLSLMIIAGFGDVLVLKISNRLILLISVLFIPAAILSGMSLADTAMHLMNGVAFLLIGFLLFSFGVFGGGDGKLLAACGLWFGASNSLSFVIYTALVGGLLALYYKFWMKLAIDAEIKNGKLFGLIGDMKPTVPYGYAFACGAILVFPQTPWFSFLN